MKIVITHDGSLAHAFIRGGLLKAFQACGHQALIWDVRTRSVFDVLDELNPDLILSQTYNMSEAWVRALSERPQTKLVLRASDCGNISDNIDLKKYPVLVASEQEKKLILRLREQTGKPDFIHNHYCDWRLKDTHTWWIKEGFEVRSLCSGADVFDFTNAEFMEELKSDICFVGGRWGYKAQTLDKWILPLCSPHHKYNIKIFGNQAWGIPQYLGRTHQPFTRNALFSSTICPNISEPHSQDFGYDIIERPFKLLSNRCLCISDYVEDLAKTIPDGIVFCKTPEEFKEKIDYFLNPENINERSGYISRGYDTVINNHTYFHRIKSIFSWFNDIGEMTKVDFCYSSIKNQLKL
jgi:hypothetical protein